MGEIGSSSGLIGGKKKCSPEIEGMSSMASSVIISCLVEEVQL
jgi:hypothetical protein